MKIALEKQAEKHIRMRWIGVPLLVSGLVLFLIAIQSFWISGSIFPVLLGTACALMGLTCFGVNHDTAICFAMEAQRADDTLRFSPQLQTELEEEMRRDRADVLALQSNPKIALFLPIVVVIVQILEGFLLFGLS